MFRDWNKTSASSPLSLLGQTTSASPSVLELTSSEVTSATSGLISVSSSEAAAVIVNHRSKAPEQIVYRDPCELACALIFLSESS